MAKLFNYYSDSLDRTWYKSSNIVYSECIDNENDFKTLIVVFANGTRYKYTGVDVNDYLLFRESESQGKALNTIIKAKKYEYEKLDNVDVEALRAEYEERIGGSNYWTNDTDNGFKVVDSKDNVVFETRFLNDAEMELITSFAEAVNFPLKKKD